MASEEILLAASKEKLKQIETAETSVEKKQHLEGTEEKESERDAGQQHEAEIQDDAGIGNGVPAMRFGV